MRFLTVPDTVRTEQYGEENFLWVTFQAFREGDIFSLPAFREEMPPLRNPGAMGFPFSSKHWEKKPHGSLEKNSGRAGKT